MPKKNKRNKQNYSLNPEVQRGFAILQNIGELNRVGAAILSHDQEVAQKIDSSVQKELQKNAKESEWLRKVKNELDMFESMSKTPYSSVGGTGVNPLGLSLARTTEAYRHIKNRDVPDMPEDYGMSDFLKDQWNSFFGEMNNLLAQDAIGYHVRAEQDKSLINSYKEGLDILDEIDNIDAQINKMRQTDRSRMSNQDLQLFDDQLALLVARKTLLRQAYDAKAGDRKQLEDTMQRSGISAAYDATMSGNGYFGKGGFTGIFGKTTAMHDEINDARRWLYDIGKPTGKSRNEIRGQLDRALAEYDDLAEEWNGIIKENADEAKRRKDLVSSWYKGREERAMINLTSPETYLFKMPGIMGGSSSSWMKQGAAMAAGIAGAWMGSPLAIAAGYLTSFGLNRGAGISENNAEVALAAKEKIKKATGMSDDDIDAILQGKVIAPDKLRKITERTRNSENLFNQDMAATTWDAAITAALDAVPFGALARANKWVRGTKAFERAMKNPVAKRVLESNVINDFGKGYNVTDVTGPIGGIVGGAVNATVGRAAKKAVNLVSKRFNPAILGKLSDEIGTNLRKMVEAAKWIKPEEIAARQAMRTGRLARYTKDIGGRMIKSGISEGIEEGKQHVNAEAFKNDELSEEIKNVFDIGLTDMLNGYKMGAYVLGIPLDGLGLIDIKDQDLLQEIKGGMLGGWAHTATVLAIREAPRYIKEMRADDLVLQQIYADKMASQADFKQYVNWLNKGLLKPGYDNVLQSFDRLREINKKYREVNSDKDDAVSPEMIDKAESNYKEIIGIAQDPLTRLLAASMGIFSRSLTNPNSWKSNNEYKEFVAAKKIALDTLREKKNVATEASTNLENVKGLIRSKMSISDEGLEESENAVNFEYTDRIAYLAALLKYRQQVELGLEAQKDNPNAKVRRGLKHQLEKINSQIDFFTKLNEDLVRSINFDLGGGRGFYANGEQAIRTLQDVENHLAYNQEEHELLRDAYEENLKASNEYESAYEAYTNLIGRLTKVDESGNEVEIPEDWDPRADLRHASYTKGNAREVLSRIHAMEKDDDKFEEQIELTFQEDLKAQHLNDENAWKNPEVAPNRDVPVNDANGNQIQITYDENGRPSRPIAEGEYIDALGNLWQRGTMNNGTIEEATRVRLSREELAREVARIWHETFTRQTGQTLPMTEEGYIQQIIYNKFKAERDGTSLPPDKGVGEKPKRTYIKPTTTVTIKEPDPQQDTLDMLDAKYEEDQKIVHRDKTTSENYYIEVDGKEVEMKRVHSVKPEPWIRREKVNELSPSIRMGNVMDDLGRVMFTQQAYDATATQAGIDSLYNSVNPHENRKYSELFTDKRAFVSMIKQMRERYRYYTEDLEWVLRTTPFVWKARFDKIGWVAGETDMIGVDKEGRIHIIDFKTSYQTFWRGKDVANMDLTRQYKANLNSITKDDFDADGKPNKKVRNIAKYISEDTGKKIVISWVEDRATGGFAAISEKSRPFIQTPRAAEGQVLSQYQDYKNQQTAYARMIAVETGGDVASIEIMPFVCTYDSAEFRVINAVNLEKRIVLPFSKQMDDILTGTMDRSQEVLESLRNEVNRALLALQRVKKELVESMSEDTFNLLSDAAKLTYTDYITSIDNLLVKDDEDIDNLQSVLDEAASIMGKYRETRNALNEDWLKLRDKAAKDAEQAAKNKQRTEHIQVEHVEATRYATNKDKSKGNTSHTNLNYTQVYDDSSLETATSAPNFITDADFVVYSEGNELYCDILFEGQSWKHIKIDTSYNGVQFPQGVRLLEQVKDLEKVKGKNQRIIPVRATMNRTKGRIRLAVNDKNKPVYQPVSNTDLFAEDDILDVEFSSVYKKFGFVDADGVVRTFDKSESDRKLVYSWTDPKKIPARGTLIYTIIRRYNEIGKNRTIPVAIDRVKLKNDDIDFILNLLLNPDLLDRPYWILDSAGNPININATGRQLANLIIPVVDSTNRLEGPRSILRDPQNPNIIYIMNNEDLATGSVGRGRFDISTPDGVLALKQELAKMSIVERHDVLSTRLGSDTNVDLPFAALRKFFIENASDPSLHALRVSSALLFNIEDFKTKTSKSGVRRNGLGGLGYYITHNLFITQYAKVGSSNVEIKDVILESENPPIVSETGAMIPEAPTVDNDPEGSATSLLFKHASDKVRRRKPLSREKALRHIKEILGDFVESTQIIDDFIPVLGCDAKVVGNCKSDAIQLSTLGWNGVEYHEAFHRIFELLVPAKERDKIYERIAKRDGIELYDSEGKPNEQAFRQVAEYAADKYMDHMKYRMTDVKIPFLTKLFNKIYDWVRTFVNHSDKDLYEIFARVNSGEFVNAKPSKEAIKRFDTLYRDLHALIHGVDFDHIMNRPMYDTIRQTALFCIIQGQALDRSGRNIDQIGKNITKETFKAGADKLAKMGYDVFGDNTQIPTVGQLALKELYDKFDDERLRDDIANDISMFSTDFAKIREEESIEEAQGENLMGASIGEHTRASYEFARFEKTSSRVRFFFATIPDSTYREIKGVDKEGKPITRKVADLALNEFGLPTFVPVNTVFNEFLNFFHDVDTISELLDRLEYLAKEDPMYKNIYDALFMNSEKHKGIYYKMYGVDGGVITRNADYEALFVQIMNIIRSNRHAFEQVKAASASGETTMQGAYTLNTQPSGTEYNAKLYPEQWNQNFVNGGTLIVKISEDGRLQFNPKIRGIETIFSRIDDTLSHHPRIETAPNGAQYTSVGIKQWLENSTLQEPKQVYLKLYVNGKESYYNNPNDSSQLEVVKDKFIEALNTVGIQFTIQELNYMLLHKYGSTDHTAMAKMFSSAAKEDSMSSFFGFLKNVATNGKINETVSISGKRVDIDKAFQKIAFVKSLGNWKYQYRHAHDILTVLATGNNKFYEISDNNYVTDILRAINKRSDEFEELKDDIYAYYDAGVNALNERTVYGSKVLQDVSRDPNLFLQLKTFIGFKTDKRGDAGSDYFEMSKREDYISKCTILEKGGIIMPTLSDKKTWFYIEGVTLPGLDYTGTIDSKGNIMPLTNIGDQFIIPKDKISQLENMLSQDPAVIDQFIQYAYSEYASILKADRDLDQMEKDGTKDTEVDNYYTKEQGAKFSSLLGVWEYTYKNDANGQPYVAGEKFVSFNKNKKEDNDTKATATEQQQQYLAKSRKQNIKTAQDHFFNLTRREQESLIARLLHKRLLKEIDTCEKLGLIEKIGNSDNIFENYKNVGLNAQALSIIYKSLVAKNGEPADGIAIDRYKSMALMIYINDISNKAIMSGQEVERIFSGNPSFYKWKYDDEGNLIDRTVDELKRLGGLISTGNNNYIQLEDVPQKYVDANGKFTGKYVAAQVNNELIESPQISLIEEAMRKGELSVAAYLMREKEELQRIRDEYKEIINIVEDHPEDATDEQRDYYNENVGRLYELEEEARRTISEQIDAMTEEELFSMLDETTRNIALRKAKEATDSYRLKYKNGKIDDGIDVADGGAYITDTMAEMLLRMCGAYSSDILKAFKILREETTSTILQKQQAYQLVITSVIGTQKYTAFGKRKHAGTGIQVAYYNKMALFPIFKCIATGRLANVFSKMNQLGIDMLMVDSAVKLGGLGSKAIVWDQFMQTNDEADPKNHVDNNVNNPLKPSFDDGFQFNTYEQKFMYLRKQLNTDPNEDPFMNVGTQMTKIVMSNLFDGRLYYLQDGTVMNGKELRDDIMNAINELSNRGYKSIIKSFFKTNAEGNPVDRDGNAVDWHSDAKVLDEIKFAKELRSLMMSKDPDKNIMDALELVELKDKDGIVRKHLRLPMNAVSNSKWLESVLISRINHKVVDVVTTGSPFIQRSVWSMEGSTMYERGKGGILSDEDMSQKINNGQRLKMVNEEGSMDCVLSEDFFRKMFAGELPVVPIKDKDHKVIWDLVPERDHKGEVKKDKDGNIIYKQKLDEKGQPMVDKNGKPILKRKIRTREMTFDELRKWLINRGIIGQNASANIIGYRIPTQALSSIHALRCVDIIPVVNDTVILPAEFTKITGSDFKHILKSLNSFNCWKILT